MFGTVIIACIGYGIALALIGAAATGIINLVSLAKSDAADSDTRSLATLIVMLALALIAFMIAACTHTLLGGAI